MNEEIKYCKFCDKEKPIKEFCKSGSCIKNICKDCHNKKQKQKYRDSKILNELEKWLVEWREMLDCPDFYEEGIIDCINDTLTKIQELKGSDKE